ncbi:MAG: trypsin-like peptidase domain-containing protein [Phycisphaerales bacterium]|nr:MAG: trypsin-like peptidase domain-containing protein [Phycisphaerales bacterium]
MELSQHFEELTEALLHAYRTESQLAMMVKFDLDLALEHVVARGPLRQMVFDLIAWTDSEGRVDELFLAALQRKPNNPRLKTLAAKLADEVAKQHEALEAALKPHYAPDQENPNADKVREALSSYETSGVLEALVVKTPQMDSGSDVEQWVTRMNESKRRVCSVGRNGNHLGTGFLIAPDRILTNAHVIPSSTSLAECGAVFDFVGKTQRSQLREYKIVAEVARSEPREFDFAAFQLEAVPEGNRKHFRVRSYQFENLREPVGILGYPNGEPLRFAYGVVFDNNSFMGRVAYTANTAPGSSGSPVFNENWDLVAIHHHGEKNVNNHGVPMNAVLKHLKGAGKEGLIEEQN